MGHREVEGVRWEQTLWRAVRGGADEALRWRGERCGGGCGTAGHGGDQHREAQPAAEAFVFCDAAVSHFCGGGGWRERGNIWGGGYIMCCVFFMAAPTS